MGMAEYELAIRAVLDSDRAHFVGPREPTLVGAVEKALGLGLPPTYRRFIAELGAGSIGGREFYGAIDANFVESTVPDGIWLTLDERAHGKLPSQLVIIGDTGMGGYYALDTGRRDHSGESPVVIWDAGDLGDDAHLELVAPDFGSFFWEVVKHAVGLG